MNLPFDNIDLGPIILTYTFKPNAVVPEVGYVIEDNFSRMEVTEVNHKNRYIKVLLTTTETANSRAKRYIEEINNGIMGVAKLLYSSTTEGMTALIGWDNLTAEMQKTYLDISEKIISELDKKNLLILPYENLK